MEKYKRQEVSPVEEENERDSSYEAGNPQIALNRTDNNYHIIRPKKSYIEFINDRLSSLTYMMSAYPNEFDELLKKSRNKKAGTTTPIRKNNNGWSK